ncbi:MAG: TetR/AcrR family transcriptional regulator [Kineosporiaceae bacterium]
MPRRSDEHLRMRRQQIVTAALRAFARDGFHATSMADLIRESGLSAGAVYRYFPSKNDLVVACAATVFDAARGVLAATLAAPEPVAPAEALRHVLTTALRRATENTEGIDFSRVAVTVWGEALRDDALRGIVRDMYAPLRADLTAVVARWRDAGHLPPDSDVEAAGQVMFGMLPGFLLQRLLMGDVDVDRYSAGVAVLTGTAEPAGARKVAR